MNLENMTITENAAKYLYKGILTICATAVLCCLIYALQGRYDSYSTDGIKYRSSGYLVDTWTGKTWHMFRYSMEEVEVIENND